MKEKEWLKENFDNYTWEELTRLYNAKFGKSLSISGIRRKIERMGLKKSKEKNLERWCTYTKEQKQFIRDNLRYYHRSELTKMFNEKFGTNKTQSQITDQIHIIKRQYNIKDNYRYKYEEILENEDMCNWLRKQSKETYQIEAVDKFNGVFKTNYCKSTIERAIKILGLEFLPNPYWWTKEMEQLLIDNNNLNDIEIAELITKYSERKVLPREISRKRKRLKINKDMKVRFNNCSKTWQRKIPLGVEKFEPSHKIVMVKIKDGFVAKKRLIWEEHYKEKLLPSDSIINLDGNPYNNDIDNLVKLTMEERNLLIGYKWYGYGDITKAGLEIIKSKLDLRSISK